MKKAKKSPPRRKGPVKPLSEPARMLASGLDKPRMKRG